MPGGLAPPERRVPRPDPHPHGWGTRHARSPGQDAWAPPPPRFPATGHSFGSRSGSPDEVTTDARSAGCSARRPAGSRRSAGPRPNGPPRQPAAGQRNHARVRPRRRGRVVEVLAYATRAGYLDLATTRGGHVVGVACWITHLARRRPSRTRASEHRPGASPLAGLRHRLELLDNVLRVPATTTHHLAYLGTRPSTGAETVADLLLHRRGQAADQDGQALYLEAHHDVEPGLLHRHGYENLNTSPAHLDTPQPDSPCTVTLRRAARRPPSPTAVSRST